MYLLFVYLICYSDFEFNSPQTRSCEKKKTFLMPHDFLLVNSTGLLPVNYPRHFFVLKICTQLSLQMENQVPNPLLGLEDPTNLKMELDEISAPTTSRLARAIGRRTSKRIRSKSSKNKNRMVTTTLPTTMVFTAYDSANPYIRYPPYFPANVPDVPVLVPVTPPTLAN